MTARQTKVSPASINARTPTSVVLRGLLFQASEEAVTLGELIGGLGDRSFGIVLLLLGLIASLPAVSVVAGVLVAVLACQMMFAREAPLLPAFVLARTVRKQRLDWMLRRVVPSLQAMERVIRPRWQTPLALTERVVGSVVFLVSILLFAPFPLSNIVPALTIALLSFAYLERDGVALLIAVVVAFAVLIGAAAAGWEGLLAADWIKGRLHI